ncbi:hypothetical protein LZ634_21900 [Kluyvera intermedia]|uniref:hypothetical protein n=1 Tax=Kluyvera intermedia TaxID=61648 RepID=UPI001F1A4AD6|nr:hypothetical protein [Kluyvera intermedia]MCE9891322.1 hypothetical protein [Kluyvera intermedia]
MKRILSIAIGYPVLLAVIAVCHFLAAAMVVALPVAIVQLIMYGTAGMSFGGFAYVVVLLAGLYAVVRTAISAPACYVNNFSR